MACGEFAEPIYTLIEDLGDTDGARELVLGNLIKFLPGQTIENFVESFRSDYDMRDNETEDNETNEFVMCMNCQDTYHEEAIHKCSSPETVFFSSRIPEC